MKLGSDSYWVALVYRKVGGFLDMIRLEDGGSCLADSPLWLIPVLSCSSTTKGFSHLVLKRTDSSNDGSASTKIGGHCCSSVEWR